MTPRQNPNHHRIMVSVAVVFITLCPNALSFTTLCSNALFANDAQPPRLLDTNLDDADRATEAARLVARFALTADGVKKTIADGNVTKTGADTWVVTHKEVGRQVTIHPLNRDDNEFKRLDLNANNVLESEEFYKKLIDTFCRDSRRRHLEDDKLVLSADLLKRIDKRVNAIAKDHKELSLWNDQIEIVERDVFGDIFISPAPKSSGKLLQFDYMDTNRRHRLVYRNHNEESPCNISIRIVAASIGSLYNMSPRHSRYGRAWVITETFEVEAELKKKLVQIIQEEVFKEPGKRGIERRGFLSAVALAHLVKKGEFPNLRWEHPHGIGTYVSHQIVRDEGHPFSGLKESRPKLGPDESRLILL
jgi:hypothetical protein